MKKARGEAGARAEVETEAAAAAAASAFRHCDTMKEALKNMPAKGEEGITMHACARVCVRVCEGVCIRVASEAIYKMTLFERKT